MHRLVLTVRALCATNSNSAYRLKSVLLLSVFLLAISSLPATAQTNPVPAQGDFTIRNFKFDSGEVLPELKLHYRTYGTPRRDGSGVVRNAVLIMHGQADRVAVSSLTSSRACSSNPDNSWIRQSTSSYCRME